MFPFDFLFVDSTQMPLLGNRVQTPVGCSLVCLQSSHYLCSSLNLWVLYRVEHSAKTKIRDYWSVCLVNLLMARVFALGYHYTKNHLYPFVFKPNFMLSWADALCPGEEKIWGSLCWVDRPCVTRHTCVFILCLSRENYFRKQKAMEISLSGVWDHLEP